MNAYSAGQIVFFAAAVLICLQSGFYAAVKAFVGKGRLYTVSKCAGCAVYILTAGASVFISGADVYTVLMLAGFLLSAGGDYYLSLVGHKRLKAGGLSFSAAHLAFSAAFITVGRLSPVQPAALAAVLLAELAVMKLTGFRFRGIAKMIIGYSAAVSAMAVLAVSLPFAGTLGRVPAVMTAAGGVMFLVSDILWAITAFGGLRKKNTIAVLKALNAVTYFPAQALMAGALLFR